MTKEEKVKIIFNDMELIDSTLHKILDAITDVTTPAEYMELKTEIGESLANLFMIARHFASNYSAVVPERFSAAIPDKK